MNNNMKLKITLLIIVFLLLVAAIVYIMAPSSGQKTDPYSPAFSLREENQPSSNQNPVPATMEELVSLPGVGRKTANLILGDVFHVPGSTVVDTHCIRLSNRLGLVDNLKEPEKIERELRKVLPPESSSQFCHCIVLHGRAVCDARKPLCESCCVKVLCQYYETLQQNPVEKE